MYGKNLLRYLLGAMSLVATAWCFMEGYDAVGYILAVGSPTMIGATRATDDFATNRLDIDFQKGIALLDPNENPFTLMTMDMSKGVSMTIQKSWWEDELVPEIDTVNGTITAGITALVVDNGDRFAVRDLIMHNAGASGREVMLVVAISSNTLTVIRDYGQAEGWTAQVDSITDGAYLTKIGNASQQGDVTPASLSTVEVEYKNYCQEQRTPFSITEVADASRVRGEDDWPFQERKAGITHDRKLEYQNIWGMAYAGDGKLFDGTHDSGDKPATGGGINYFITRYGAAAQKLDETEITSDEFQAWMEDVFEYGSATKFCYCPGILRTALDKWGISKLNTFTTTTSFGMAVGTWVSSHGTVHFITHKMLKNPAAPTDWYYSFILDMEQVSWITFQKIGSTRLDTLDEKKATGATKMTKEYHTYGCVKFGLVPTHNRLRFKTIGA